MLGADGYLKLLHDQVRAPDVSFIRWQRFPDRKLPKAAIYDVAPDLAVEVLSESNTAAEMNRKLRDYFKAGKSMVWYIDPPTRTALVHRRQAVDRYRPGRFAAGRRSAAGIRVAAGETVCTRRVSRLVNCRFTCGFVFRPVPYGACPTRGRSNLRHQIIVACRKFNRKSRSSTSSSLMAASQP